MLFWSILVASVLTYSAIGVWTFGFYAARAAGHYNIEHGYDSRSAGHYYDEPETWFCAILWPVYLLFVAALKHGYALLWRHGEKRGEKMIEAKKVRIAEMKRIRVEQEKAEREAQEEIEAALRREENESAEATA